MARAMNILNLCHGGTKSSSYVTPSDTVGPNKFTFPSIDAAVRTIPVTRDRNSSLNSKLSSSAQVVASSSPLVKEFINGNITSNQNYNLYNSNNADLASVDSSDTFMSCQTHPFLSQGDLTTADDDDTTLDMLDSESLYLNAMNKTSSGTLTRGSSLYSGAVNIIDVGTKGQVKKSTSGDTALRSLGTSPIDDNFTGSRVSLSETPVPKHRKTRFQQQQQLQQQQMNMLKPKTRFDDVKDSIESLEVTVTTSSNKKNRRASFMPTKIITTATKQLINQHLFGIQTKGN